MNEKFGLIGAMPEEVSALRQAASVSRTVKIAGMEFCEGRLEGRDAVIVQCGMGKVNAGVCAQTLISVFGVTHVLNTGVAGSLDASMDVGDFVVSEDAVEHDFDVSPIGFQRGEIPYTGLYAFPADERLRQAAAEAVRRCAPEVGVHVGRVCSGDQFIASAAQKDAIVSRFGGLCCEMEGAAVAQVCHLNGVPFVILRAISDKADDESGVDFAVFSAEAAKRCAAVVRDMLAHLK